MACSDLTGKSKKEGGGVKEEKRKREAPVQPPKPAKPTPGSKTQHPPPVQQPQPPQPQPAGFSAHKEIKLTLLNKVREWGGWGSLQRVVVRFSGKAPLGLTCLPLQPYTFAPSEAHRVKSGPKASSDRVASRELSSSSYS